MVVDKPIASQNVKKRVDISPMKRKISVGTK